MTQFPLFTRADEDKDFLAKGRWASSHHPFTAPMFEDLEALKKGDVEGVSYLSVVHELTRRSGDSITILCSTGRKLGVGRLECTMRSCKSISCGTSSRWVSGGRPQQR